MVGPVQFVVTLQTDGTYCILWTITPAVQLAKLTSPGHRLSKCPDENMEVLQENNILPTAVTN